jgi:hypothetical protein
MWLTVYADIPLHPDPTHLIKDNHEQNSVLHPVLQGLVQDEFRLHRYYTAFQDFLNLPRKSIFIPIYMRGYAFLLYFSGKNFEKRRIFYKTSRKGKGDRH